VPLKQIINQDPSRSAEPRESAHPSSATAPITHSQQPQSTRTGTLMSSSKNILSNDVEIRGNLKFSHDLIIDGRIEGEVNSDGNLTVGENAVIKGEIKTKSVTVFGKVEGNITVQDRAELKSQAELIGDIKAGTLSIEEGATFMGSSTVGRAATGAAGSSAPSGKPSPAPNAEKKLAAAG
jgi:cytoskeletal protein CcmA (bactofilin family)